MLWIIPATFQIDQQASPYIFSGTGGVHYAFPSDLGDCSTFCLFSRYTTCSIDSIRLPLTRSFS